jgi:general secretion pathway protein I
MKRAPSYPFCCSHGFTLLEVMVALAIMASVVMTVLGSVNYHLGIIAEERDTTNLTLLARARIAELEQGVVPTKSEGTFAPAHPELKWHAELLSTELPGLKKLLVRVQRESDKREVALVRYIVPK